MNRRSRFRGSTPTDQSKKCSAHAPFPRPALISADHSGAPAIAQEVPPKSEKPARRPRLRPANRPRSRGGRHKRRRSRISTSTKMGPQSPPRRRRSRKRRSPHRHGRGLSADRPLGQAAPLSVPPRQEKNKVHADLLHCAHEAQTPRELSNHLGRRPVVAIGQFLVPLAVLVLVNDAVGAAGDGAGERPPLLRPSAQHHAT